MTDYAKAALTVLYSGDAEYADIEWQTQWDAVELTPTHGYAGTIEIDTGGTTIVQASEIYDSMSLVAIRNLEAAGGNKITVTWTDSNSNANTQDIPAGRMLVLPDVIGTTAVVGTATTAAVSCRFAVLGT